MIVIAALGGAQTLAWGSTYYLPAILAALMVRDFGMVFAAFSAALIVAAVLGRRIDQSGSRDVLALESDLCCGPRDVGRPARCADAVRSLADHRRLHGHGPLRAVLSTLAGISGREARGAITGITPTAGFASTICWSISASLKAQLGWRDHRARTLRARWGAICIRVVHGTLGVSALLVSAALGIALNSSSAANTHETSLPCKPRLIARTRQALCSAKTRKEPCL
jgi:hypothetical protein